MSLLRRTYNLVSILVVLLFTSFSFSSCSSSKRTSKTNQQRYISEDELVVLKSMYYEATTKKVLGDYDAALSMFRQCIALDPTCAAANYEMADILEYDKQPDTALQFINRAVQLEPSNIWYQELYAQCLQEKGRYKEVENVYNNLIKDNPAVSDYYYKLATVQLQAGEIAQAAQTYETAEQKLGYNEQLSMNIVDIYEKIKDYANAERKIQELIDHSPSTPQNYDMLGNLYELEGKNDKAFGIYQKLEQTSPNDPMVHLSLADFYRERHNEDSAFEELKLAFKQPSLDIDTKMRILYTSFLEVGHGNDSIAREGLTLCALMVEADPAEAKAHEMYGKFLAFRARDFVKAKEQYQFAIAEDSSKFIAWDDLMNVEETQLDYPALANTSKRAIDLFPDRPTIYLLNGIANYQLKKYDDASSVLQVGIGYVVDDSLMASQFYSLMGDSYNFMRNYAASDSAYEAALKIAPNDDGVLNNYSYYLSLRDVNLDKAAAMSKKSNALVPNSATYEDTYAWVLYKAGKYQEAKDWEDKAMQHGGAKDLSLLDHYGDILYKLGDIDGALNYWQKAKDGGLKSDVLDKKIQDRKLYEK